jgi:hypothetical protein
MTLIRASLGIEHRRLALASTNTGQARLSTAKYTKAEINFSGRERYRCGSIGAYASAISCTCASCPASASQAGRERQDRARQIGKDHKAKSHQLRSHVL